MDKKKGKNRVTNVRGDGNKANTLGYVDIDTSRVLQDSTLDVNNHPHQRTDYADLAHPPPDSKESNNSEDVQKSIVFPEICSNEEATSYDFPLPILSDQRSGYNHQVIKENGLKDNNTGLASVADPFADDPFDPVGKSKEVQMESNCEKGPLVVSLPPKPGNRYSTELRCRDPNKDRRPANTRSFTKARSTDDVLDESTSTNFVGSRTPSMNDHCANRNSTAASISSKNVRPTLVTRNSWGGAEAKSYSNPIYGAEPFDPSKLEASDGHKKAPRFPDEISESSQNAMQFYEEDFTILQAQGYTREEITRALIVAENNFAMARKILREFSQGTRKL